METGNVATGNVVLSESDQDFQIPFENTRTLTSFCWTYESDGHLTSENYKWLVNLMLSLRVSLQGISRTSASPDPNFSGPAKSVCLTARINRGGIDPVECDAALPALDKSLDRKGNRRCHVWHSSFSTFFIGFSGDLQLRTRLVWLLFNFWECGGSEVGTWSCHDVIGSKFWVNCLRTQISFGLAWNQAWETYYSFFPCFLQNGLVLFQKNMYL